MASKTKLKPCPFCGGHVKVKFRRDLFSRYWVECSTVNCPCRDIREQGSHNAAVGRWNNRRRPKAKVNR